MTRPQLKTLGNLTALDFINHVFEPVELINYRDSNDESVRLRLTDKYVWPLDSTPSYGGVSFCYFSEDAPDKIYNSNATFVIIDINDLLLKR